MIDFNALNNMVDWERTKAMYLIEVARRLGMDSSGYGEIGVNKNTGYTYLWLEDYNFTLYLPINCDLKVEDVMVLWTNSNTGEETEINLNDNTLNDLIVWTDDLEKQINED
jgi:hypothetical protein